MGKGLRGLISAPLLKGREYLYLAERVERRMKRGIESIQSCTYQKKQPVSAIGYMPGLDGLRTVAVFAVILYHLGVKWAPGGLLGVNLFFVLSGYLITNILQAQWESAGKIDLKDFWIRRGRRLLPALLIMLVILLLWAVFFEPERLSSLGSEALAGAFYASNWYLIFHKVSYFESFGPPSPMGHLWSLAIEGQFYLIWPILLGLGFGLGKSKGKKIIIALTAAIVVLSALAMALLYIPGTDPSRVYYGTDTRAFALILGGLAAMILPGNKMSSELPPFGALKVDLAGIACLSAILWMMLKTNQYQTFLYQSGLLIFSLLSAVLVVILAHPAGRIGKAFGWEPLRLLGEWSYGIYLWHYPVIVLSNPLVNTEGPGFLLSLWQITVTVILAALSYYLIEKPIRHGRLKPVALSARVAVSAALIFGIMLMTSTEGMQIMAQDFMGDKSQVVQGEADSGNDGSDGGLIGETNDNDIIIGDDESGQGSDGEIEKEDEVHGPGSTEGDLSGTESGGNTGTPGGQKWTDELIGLVNGDSITIISDSLLLDAKPFLEEILPGIVIDAKLGRQMYDAPEVISELQKKGKLGKTVIIGLGSNGAFTEKQLKKTLDALTDADDIILLNTRVPKPWETVVNETLSKVDESYPEVKLIDWYGISKGHGEYFYKDGVHLNYTGIEAYCKMLVGVLTD